MTTRALTFDEVAALESALIARRRFRDRAFLVLAVNTGFRVSELLSIKWHQVLTPAGEVAREILIERAQLKGGAGKRRKVVRSRRVPLTERVRGALADLMGQLGTIPTGPVFRSRVGDGQPITRGQAHRWLKRLAREIGLDGGRIGTHSARKLFAVQVHRASGGDLIKTQRVLGHSSPITTGKYLETSQDELDALVLSLDVPPSPSTGLAPTPFPALPSRFPSAPAVAI
jgi:integrase